MLRLVTDLYCVKAAWTGPTLAGACGDAIIDINCSLFRENLPVINGAYLEKIAANFQPKLLDYRFRYFAQVRDSSFDATILPISLRMLARALGSCIVDAPELQAAIVPLLESQGEVLHANRLLDPNCVAIEAMLDHCHRENGSTRIGVSEIATTATSIVADRGETAVFESKRMGIHLRLLGFRAKRDSKGFAVHLTSDVRRFIHRLARDHRIVDLEDVVPGCPYCSEGMSVQTKKSNP